MASACTLAYVALVIASVVGALRSVRGWSCETQLAGPGRGDAPLSSASLTCVPETPDEAGSDLTLILDSSLAPFQDDFTGENCPALAWTIELNATVTGIGLEPTWEPLAAAVRVSKKIARSPDCLQE